MKLRHPDKPTGPVDPLTRAVRCAAAGLLLSLWWKYEWLWAGLRDGPRLSLHDPFFPAWLRSTGTAAAAFAAATAGFAAVLLRPGTKVSVAGAFAGVAACGTLTLHQAYYNDATYTTCFWVAAWTLWATRRLGRLGVAAPALREAAHRRSARLAQSLVALMFLGGAAGKLTPGYWSGAVLYDIYFVDRDFWCFNLLRAYLSPEALRRLATYYARAVVVTELLAVPALLWLPARAAATLGIVLVTGVVVCSNFYLGSVMACLAGMLAGGLWVTGPPPQQAAGATVPNDGSSPVRGDAGKVRRAA